MFILANLATEKVKEVKSEAQYQASVKNKGVTKTHEQSLNQKLKWTQSLSISLMG
jgi:hypothetical protein